MVEHSESLRMVKKYLKPLQRTLDISKVGLKGRPVIDHYFSIVFFVFSYVFSFFFSAAGKRILFKINR